MNTALIDTPRGAFGARTTHPAPGTPPRAAVLCVHGFPDDASTFDLVAQRLAESGHRVTSVYLRGYAPSPTVGPFSVQDLSDDLAALAAEIGLGEPVHFIGHDYGAQIGYAALAQHPSLFRSAVLLSGAHPAAISRNSRRHPRQLWLSRYIVFFQLGGFADRRVERNDFAALDRLWDRWSPGGIDTEHRARVKETIARSMPAPIAMYRGGGFSVGETPIEVPTLFVAGADDGCSLPSMADGQERYFAAPYERRIWPGVGHFPQLEAPDRTSQTAREWFAAHG